MTMSPTENSDKTTILIIARWPVGGIKTFFKYFFCNFDMNRYQLLFIFPYDADIAEFSFTLNIPKSNFYTVEKPASYINYLPTIIKVLRQNKVDLINSHGFTAGIYSIVPSKLTRTPHLMSVHFTFWENYFGGIKGLIKKTVLSLAFNLVDHIHCVSNDSRKSLVRELPLLRYKNKNLHVIHNGIDTNAFSGNNKENFFGEDIPKGTILIGYFGRFMPEKGFNYLIDAIKILKGKTDLDKNFAVLCFGWGGYIREEQKKLKESGIDHLFHFMDYRENIAPSIRGLSMVVMPSLQEAGPLLPMETMVTGTPFIGTNCIGLREVLENTPAYVVPPSDSKALANAIISEMRQSRREEFVAFIEEAKNRFEVKKQAIELEQLISAAISK